MMLRGAPTTEPAKSTWLNHRHLPQVDRPLASASDQGMASNASWDFARISVHPAPPPPPALQKKLVVGSSHDPLEREADAMADRVMSNSPATQADTSATSAAAGSMQRMCATCTEEDEEGTTLRRSAVSPSGATMTSPPIVHDVLRSSGSPLDASTRQFMESRFNHDFSRVRVHADAAAAESARQVNARAYTVGNSVVFGDGQYAPGTSTGRHLLAHELAHTLQQEQSGFALVQRAEVDDDPRLCDGFTDIESKVDAEVNGAIAAARKSSEGNFVLKVKEGLWNPKFGIESWAYHLPESHKPSKDDEKYAGTSVDPTAVVKVAGFCIGVDKLGHFIDDGYSVYKAAHDKVDLAEGDKAALLDSKDREIANQGLGETGVYSRADITTNMAGRRFYQELEKNPNMEFKIRDFISKKWNEVKNPSYYTEDVGKVVWGNVLAGGNWSGRIAFPGGEKRKIDVAFGSLDTSSMLVMGTFNEHPISGGSSRGGDIEAYVSLRTKRLKGKTKGVTGIELDITFLSVSDAPPRSATLKSEGERKLVGTWEEEPEEKSGEKSSGTWWLKRG